MSVGSNFSDYRMNDATPLVNQIPQAIQAPRASVLNALEFSATIIL